MKFSNYGRLNVGQPYIDIPFAHLKIKKVTSKNRNIIGQAFAAIHDITNTDKCNFKSIISKSWK